MAQRLKTRCPSKEEFLNRCSVDNSTSLIGAAFKDGTPTLKTLEIAYGIGTAAQWLIPRLSIVNEFAGVKSKMDSWQIQMLATTIAQEYSDLNVGEFEMFFQMLRAGKFGKFYGSVDPMVITDALNDFLDERNILVMRERRRRDEELRQQEIEERKRNAYKPTFDVAKRVLAEMAAALRAKK